MAELKTYPNRKYWYSSIMEHYTKIFLVRLWSVPILWDSLPSNLNVLPAVAMFHITNTEVDNIYVFTSDYV